MPLPRRLCVLLPLTAIAACAAGDKVMPAPPVEPLSRYELRTGSHGLVEACRRPGEEPQCRQLLTLTRRAVGASVTESEKPVCCWKCANGLNTCGGEQWPGRPVAIGARRFPVGGRCETVAAADFEGEGQTALRLYLDWLVRAHGAPYVGDPGEVALAFPASHPDPAHAGVTGGEVSCGGGKHAAPFKITLFRDALEGRKRRDLYGALAHEFQHVLQIRRDGLACKPSHKTRAPLEREAEAFARSMVPPCD